ncbi:MAG: YncE family protein [Bacteroidetes bacterium]|nr:YncE family protein [Bacteroidota bacterium]
MKTVKQLLTLSLIFLTLVVLGQSIPGQYKLIKEIPVEGDGFWDYLSIDQGTGRLFLSHGTIVQVIDLATEKVIGVIPNTTGVHGIAIELEAGKGYISDGRIDTITVIDCKTLATLGKIASTGKNPDAIIYDPYSKRVCAFNGRSQNITVIDVVADKVVGTIPVSGKPEFAVSDGKGKMFVNIEDKSTIVKFDPVTLKVEAEWPLAPGKEPSGLAYDKKNQRLFSACSDSKQMVVMNATNGKVIQALPMGAGCDGLIFIPEDKNIITSNGEGTLTVIHQNDPDHYSVIQTLPTKKGARTITYDPKTKKIYLPTAEVKMENGKRAVTPGSFKVLVVSK